MTPAPGFPCFRHAPEDGSCYYDAVRPKPIPMDPSGRGAAKAAAAGRSVAGNTSGTVSAKLPICGRVEKSLLPLKKRASSDTSSSSDHSGADGSFVIPPKKRRPDTASDGTSAYGIPVQAHQYDTEYATTARPNPSSSKAIVGSQQPPPQQQHKKLMHEGIRSGRVTTWYAMAACDEGTEQAETSAAGAARAKKKKVNRNRNSNGKGNNRRRRPAREAETPVERKLRPSDELSQTLAFLGATDLKFVSVKKLHKSDVDKYQNRLLFSCKREFVEGHPITQLFANNEKETYFVNQCEPGLLVSAFDGHGNEFEIKLKYLHSNGAYRLITGWSGFVEANQLYGPVTGFRRVDVELWAFRSRMLPEQPMLKDEAKRLEVEGLEDDEAGALGLLFIPYVDGVDISNVHPAEEEGAEEEIIERAPPVHETKRQASAKAVREEKRIADHVRANRGKPAASREMTIGEVIREVGLDLADSLIGLLMLKLGNNTSSRCSPVPMLDSTHRSIVAPRYER